MSCLPPSWRSRIVYAPLASVAFLLSAAGVARAQEVDSVLVDRHKNFESPQHFAAEVRFSPFRPDIDSDPALAGKNPYATTFGGAHRILVSGEFDWQVLRIPHFGTIGPGLAIGYTKMSGDALFATPHGPTKTLVSGETTALEIFPFDAIAVLRIDALWRDVGIPLEPYLKAGVGLSLWRASNTGGTSTYVPNSGASVIGEGHSLGTHFALGIGFNLNVLDEYAAKSWDQSMGVNNSYLFAEWTQEDLKGLGIQSNVLRVGGTSWTFGLAFEF